MDPGERDLEKIRKAYSEFTLDQFIDKVFETANMEAVVMTNSPFEGGERKAWLSGHKEDSRFMRALRFGSYLENWNQARKVLKEDGFKAGTKLDNKALPVLKKFHEFWAEKMDPVYLAVSIPPDFRYPARNNVYTDLVAKIMVPLARQRGIPVAVMIGCRRQINPALGDAGDGVGAGDVPSIEALCRDNSDVKFMVTMLSRENQHELCVAARKFRNLMIFGCWWFLNNPSIIEEMTRERLELLGLSMIPQHSDCRVMDQLIYKWDHSKRVIGRVMADKYRDLLDAGWTLNEDDIRRDIKLLFADTFKNYISG
jgi:hypothetical protein